MALLRANRNEIPPDAVILNENDALHYQIKLLKDWKNTSDVWAFKYGGVILSSLSAVTGIYLNNHYRSRLKLFSYGRAASYLPICVLPACLTFLTHSEFVLPSVILQKTCAVCTEMRASALQSTIGCLLPAALAPISTFSLAMRYGTYDVPYITQPIKVFNFWRTHTKPIGNIIFALFLGHALAGSFITYLEAKSVQNCNNRLIELENELENAVNQ